MFTHLQQYLSSPFSHLTRPFAPPTRCFILLSPPPHFSLPLSIYTLVQCFPSLVFLYLSISMDTQKGDHGGVKEVRKTKVSMSEVGLRFLAFSLTLVAAVLVGVDKQTKIVAIPVVPTLPPLNVPVPAKFHYFSALVYFVVVNATACAYAIISVVLTLASKGGNKGGLALMITTLDLVMLALLSTANGATGGVGLIGIRGNSHVMWKKVCNVFDKFCHQMLAGLVLSVLGSAIFLLLLVISARKLQKTHY